MYPKVINLGVFQFFFSFDFFSNLINRYVIYNSFHVSRLIESFDISSCFSFSIFENVLKIKKKIEDLISNHWAESNFIESIPDSYCFTYI